MLTWLLSLIPGVFQTINGITTAIANERIAQLSATTQQEQIASQERIDTLQAQRDLFISESSHSSLDAWIRAFIAIGPSVYLTKIYIYDKVLGFGSTDPLDTNLWSVTMAVIGFYFLYSGAVGIARIVKS